MKICVTGACGFVGRHFVKRLTDDGHQVQGVDNMSAGIPPREWAFQPAKGPFGFSMHYGDVRNWFRNARASDFDLIIHCAAVVGGRLKIDGDPLAVATDLAIDSDFFRWCVADRKNLPKKIVYFSSSAVYPICYQTRARNFPLPEIAVVFDRDQIGMPDQTYGWSKLTGELLAGYAAKTYGLDVVIYRPFSGYGEDQDETYPFPAIIRRVVNREDPIVIWGSGEQLRDFIHIDDVVAAVLETKDCLQPGEVLNLGSGEGISFIDLAFGIKNTLDQQLGYAPEIICDSTKPEGVFARVADITRMRQFYQPKVSLLEGIRRSLDFCR